MTSKARAEAQLARSAARLAAVQALYQMEIAGTDWQTVQREFEDYRLGSEIEGTQYHEANVELFRDILKGVVEHQVAIDQLTDRALVEKWPLGRVDATLRAIFRSAGYELTARPDIPPRVIIGEYIDVTKAFFSSGKEAKFVNAVIDHIAHEVRAADLLKD